VAQARPRAVSTQPLAGATKKKERPKPLEDRSEIGIVGWLCGLAQGVGP
jgi:hypothetical protein